MAISADGLALESNCDFNDLKTHWKMFQFNATNVSRNDNPQRETLQNRAFDTKCVLAYSYITPEIRACDTFNDVVSQYDILSFMDRANVANEHQRSFSEIE